MKNKLVELVNLWAEFEESHPAAELDTFCRWVLARQTPAAREAVMAGVSVDGRIGRLIGKLGRYASIYSKKAFAGLPLNNFEDLGYLWQTEFMGAPTKSELIHAMLSEFPSGVDVIKRLVGLGLLEEFPDERDKRSKRVRLTRAGSALAAESRPIAGRVAQVVVADLSEPEKTILLGALEHLAEYHDERYKAVRGAEDFEAVYRGVKESV